MMKLAPQPTTKRLLISFAHPDDESFGMGGTIAYYVEQGVDISLICSTNGDAGVVTLEFLEGYQTIGDLRLDELRCAAETLGIKTVLPYGYRDSGMMGTPENNHPDCLWQADETVVVGRIVHDIRRIQPQVIVTFDPYGGYGHPDHIYMHRATTRAFHMAGDPAHYPAHQDEGLEPYQPAKLYYNTFPRAFLWFMIWQARLRGEDPRHMGRNQDIDLHMILEKRLPTHTRIPIGAYQAAWDTAAECHASQQNPRQMTSFLDRLFRLAFRHQGFTRAWPEPNRHERIERDFFAGIAEG